MANERSDITITSSRKTLNLMLALDDKGKPLWNTSYARPLATQQFETAGFASKPPEQELIISQGDFSAGFGKLITEPTDSGAELKKYGCAVGVDCRIPGKAILGPLVNETLIGATSGNDNFETGDPPTGWTARAGGTWERSSTYAHGGTYSGYRIAGTGVGTGGLPSVYFPKTAHTAYRGAILSWSIWVKCDTAGKAWPCIWDANSGSTSHTDGTANVGTGWEQLTVTHTVSNASEYLRIGIDTDSATAIIYIDDVSCLITNPGATVASAELGGYSYMADTRRVYLLNSTLGIWEPVFDSATGITDMIAYGDSAATPASRIYVAIGTGKYYYTDDGTTFTQATPALSVAHLFTFENQNIWKASNANEVKSTFDPVNATSQWSTAVLVGDQQYNFTEAINHLGRAYFAKANGLFTLSSAGAVTEVIPMRSTPNTDNFEQSHSSGVDQRLYCPVGQNGLLYYDDGTKDNCAPAKYGPAFGDFLGQVRALASDSNWNYAVTSPVGSTYATANYSIVWAMRRETISGDTDYRWHPIAEVKIDDVRCAWVSGLLTNPRLWIAGRHTTSSNENKPKYIILSRYLSPLDDSNCRYTSSGILVTPYYTANFNIVDKAFHYFTLLSQSLSTGHYTITVEYQIDGDSSWTDVGQGTAGTFVTSPSENKFFSNAPASTSVSGKKIRFKFTLATDAAATTPILNSFGVAARLMSKELKTFDFVVRCTDKDAGKDSSELKHTAQEISTELHAISQDTYPVALIDIWGTTYYVDLLAPTPMEDNVTIAQDGEHMVSEIRCLALEAKVA